jgi:hypothetical protein
MVGAISLLPWHRIGSVNSLITAPTMYSPYNEGGAMWSETAAWQEMIQVDLASVV